MTQAVTPRRSRGWIWFFLSLLALSTIAVVSLIVYNLSRQLKPEELTAARRLWEQKDMRDYRLTYTIKKGHDASVDRFVVRVVAGKVVSAAVNGKPEPANRLHYYGMDRLFDDIERFLEVDKEKGQPRTFTHAQFDGADGHLLSYVRRVMGGTQRVEITVDSLAPLRNGVDDGS